MTEKEKLDNIPIMKEKGNSLFHDKKYKEATDVYAQAIGLLEQLMLS